MFANIYRGKKILLTGHTGFKGPWLTTWLLHLGANVIGVSKDIPTKRSLYSDAIIENEIQQIWGDILNEDLLTKTIKKYKPIIQLEIWDENIKQCNINKDDIFNLLKDLNYNYKFISHEDIWCEPVK